MGRGLCTRQVFFVPDGRSLPSADASGHGSQVWLTQGAAARNPTVLQANSRAAFPSGSRGHRSPSLELNEATGRDTKTLLDIHLEPSVLELPVSSSVPPAVPQTESGSNGRWEMVVPKMVRTGKKTFEPARWPFPDVAREVLASPDPRLLPPPLFANYETQSLLSQAFTVIGKRTRALLESPTSSASAPPISSPEMEERHVARELFLSKIARAVRGRPQGPVSLLDADRLEERWP